jgi:ferritin-like metal-binding protein YciE
MEPKEHLVAWLNDAYSMENALVQTLENHADDAKNHPQMEARIRRHIEETRHHAELVESCVRRLGADTSTMKNIAGTLFGTMQGIATGMYEDELVKNALMDFAAEQFEIACYKALIVAAEDLGDHETAHICRTILRDEEEMAGFLSQNLPMIVHETLGITAS